MSFQNVNTRTINWQPYPPPGGGGSVGPLNAIDVADGAGGFLDSGVTSTTGAIAGVESLTENNGVYLGPLVLIGQTGNELDLDAAANFPNNMILAFDRTNDTMILGAGVMQTKDANLGIQNNSVSPLKNTEFRSLNGPINILAGTTLYESAATSVQLNETTDGHTLTMDAGGVVLNSSNSQPLSVTSTGDATLQSMANALVTGVSSVAVTETTDGHAITMNSSGVNISAGTNEPITLSTVGVISVNAVTFDRFTNVSNINSISITDGVNSVMFGKVAGAASYPISWPALPPNPGDTIRNSGGGVLVWGP